MTQPALSQFVSFISSRRGKSGIFYFSPSVALPDCHLLHNFFYCLKKVNASLFCQITQEIE